jgi:hypothetical protein
MPEFGNPFAGLAFDRKLSNEERDFCYYAKVSIN